MPVNETDESYRQSCLDLAFEPFPKMARLNRDIVITEKIDGTNAQVCISEDGQHIRAGSRTRFLVPGHNDNYGFADWVEQNKESLLKLGPGRHFGEWWGAGIQRRYGLTEKRFSLFNVSRWVDIRQCPLGTVLAPGQELCPMCCHVVPVLYSGPFSQGAIICALEKLRDYGSVAAPLYDNPEGIVIYHTTAKTLFKVTIKDDEQPKSLCNSPS